MIPKFRAWHKEKKMMGLVSYISFATNEIGFYGSAARGHQFSCRTDEIELMQWTGLQDVTGKDIYEGDIIFTETGRKVKVTYSNACFFMTDIEEPCESEWMASNYYGELQVAGNIYEHSELLEKSNGN